MARILARTALTLPRPAPAPVAAVRLPPPPSRTLCSKVEFVEIDLSEEPHASSGGGSVGDGAAPMRMRRLEDAIHGVLVRRAAPDWLPFVPGGSYWVPPMPRPLGVADLIDAALYKSAGGGASSVLTEEEALCFTTARGWPSAKYFVEGKFPHPVERSRKDATQTDDEES